MPATLINARGHRYLVPAMVLTAALSFSSCITYRVQTQKLEGTEYEERKVSSLFWGIVQNPKVITTPVCDSLGTPGMSEVYIRRNFGHYLLSSITIGIYNPAIIKWKCSKPCPKTGNL
ncbi:hypothetical protein SAMN05421788_107348 [Filimonas lacunae]|uniref:Bor protein n=1 Tax=Filimonas lacunae TaxID=477680 RepID=A0A173MGS4_9BACT|nr:hypothetical protein [Filimonas lacunae]BAV06690.1 hypothetical protein FLA_2709 [Filimonas lacunae]SIT27919.1 hypothetical protein SAMN05421788_107348 [Filimonas lacunae]